MSACPNHPIGETQETRSTLFSPRNGQDSPAIPKPAANFDRLAHLYRWMEYASFGPWLWKCRCAFFADLLACRRALVLGDGDGRFTARLLAANPQIEVDAVDASAAMLRSLERRAAPHRVRLRAERADVRMGDAQAWNTPHAPYDLVATHFFLDCLTTEEVRALAHRVRPAAAGGARWVVSEFAVPAGPFGRFVARPIVALLYAAFGLMTGLEVRTLSDHSAALRSSGFVLEKKRTWLGGLLVSEIWRADPRSPVSAPRA